MAILLDGVTNTPRNVDFVEDTNGLLKPFDCSTNCVALLPSTFQPLDILAQEIEAYLVAKGHINFSQNPSEFGVTPDLMDDMRSEFRGNAAKEFAVHDKYITTLQALDSGRIALRLVWPSRTKLVSHHIHYDPILHNDVDRRQARRILCSLNCQDSVTVGFAPEDVVPNEDLYFDDKNYAVTDKEEGNHPIFFHSLDERAVGFQFPVGTIVAFAYGPRHGVSDTTCVNPFAHVTTKAASNEGPRLLLHTAYSPNNLRL